MNGRSGPQVETSQSGLSLVTLLNIVGSHGVPIQPFHSRDGKQGVFFKSGVLAVPRLFKRFRESAGGSDVRRITGLETRVPPTKPQIKPLKPQPNKCPVVRAPDSNADPRRQPFSKTWSPIRPERRTAPVSFLVLSGLLLAAVAQPNRTTWYAG